MRKIITVCLIVGLSGLGVTQLAGCGVILPDMMIVGTEQGIRAYNDGQIALATQQKAPYWSNRRVQSSYSVWDRLSRGFVATKGGANE